MKENKTPASRGISLAPWNTFLEEKRKKSPNYFIWAPVSKILEDFYYYLKKNGKILP